MSDRDTSPFAWGLAMGLKPPERLPLGELASKNVHVFGSPYGSKYDSTVIPAHNFIFDAFKDHAIKEIANVAPTGFGKTTIFEVCGSYAVAQDPGDMLILGQNDKLIRDWMEGRFLKSLRASPWTKDFIPTGQYRNDAKKDQIIFKHMNLFTGGANESNTQEKSMRYCFGDEPWRWKDKMIGEFLRRHHNRLNRKMLLQSQGGDEGTEWHKFALGGKWHNTHHKCPECGEYTPISVGMLKYGELDEKSGKQKPQKDSNGEYDWVSIYESVRLVCPECEAEFKDTDTNRRQWAKCKPVWDGNKHYPDRHTYSSTFLTVWNKEWRDIVKIWIEANDAVKQGNLEPLKQFVNKEMGQFWETPTDAPNLDMGGEPYHKIQYHEGEKWEGEHARHMKVDNQKEGFWVTIRAWKIGDIASRQLWEGKVDTWQGLFDLEERFGINTRDVFIDGRYGIDEIVRQMTLKHGKDINGHWTILMGAEAADGYNYTVGTKKNARKVKKIFSKYQYGRTTEGLPYRYVSFSNLRAKDALAAIMDRGEGMFGVPVDVSKNYISQMQSESKKEISPGKWGWKKIKDHYHNHLWDCEVMGIVAASIRGVLKIED